MQQLILQTTSKHMKDRKVISSQHRFMEGRSCLISPITFYDDMTSSMDEGMFVFYFSKAFNTVSRNVLHKQINEVQIR